MLKWMLRIGVLLILLAVIAVGIGIWQVDRLARTAIERGGTYALGVPTTLEGASVGLLSGELGLSGLQVANPEGFDEQFIELADGQAEVSLASLREERIMIPQITLDDVGVFLQKRNGKFNYEAILDSLKKLESGEKPENEEQTGTKQYLIKTIRITNVHVRLDPDNEVLGVLEVVIPEIILHDVPDDGNADTMDALVRHITKGLLTSVVENVAGRLPQEVLDEMGGLVSGLGSRLGELTHVSVEVVGSITGKLTDVTGKVHDLGSDLGGAVEQLGGHVEGVGEGVGSAVQGAGSALKGIGDALKFGGSKKDDE